MRIGFTLVLGAAITGGKQRTWVIFESHHIHIPLACLTVNYQDIRPGV